jgi:hypothetical protein
MLRQYENRDVNVMSRSCQYLELGASLEFRPRARDGGGRVQGRRRTVSNELDIPAYFPRAEAQFVTRLSVAGLESPAVTFSRNRFPSEETS